MIPDVSTAIGTNLMSSISWDNFRLFKSSAALDAEQGFKMVVCRLLAENESEQVTSQAKAFFPRSSAVAPIEADRFENLVKAGSVQ